MTSSVPSRIGYPLPRMTVLRTFGSVPDDFPIE